MRDIFGHDLPHKFKFGVTGCQNNCLKAEENDVGIKGAIRVNWNSGCMYSVWRLCESLSY